MIKFDTKKIKNLIEENFSLRVFLIGTGFVLVLFGSFLVFMSSKTNYVLTQRQARMPTKTVLIERIKTASPDTLPFNQDTLSNDPRNAVTSQDISAHTKNGRSLKQAPFEGLTEETDEGLLPKVSEKGLTPFHAYKRPFLYKGGPIIALAIMDYGLSEESSKNAILKLPPDVTMIMSPYATEPDFWQEKARKTGHELWVHMPLQNENYPETDSGPKILLSNASIKHNQKNMDWLLSRTTGYAGVVSHSDGIFLRTPFMLQSILDTLSKRGLSYFEINPEGLLFIETKTLANKTPYARNNVLIDILTPEKMTKLETMALEKGYAVAVLSPVPKTLKSTESWVKILQDKGIQLAPLSTIAEAVNK